MQRKTKHLLVISFDALSSLDFDYFSQLPSFSSYLKGASYCKNVTSVYPTLTYPAHASIITGRYPSEHGVINNTLIQPNSDDPDWYWQRKFIKGETLFDRAIDNGMKVASLLWPVTAKSRIQYNLPEIFANKRWQTQIMVSLLNGTPIYQYRLNKMFGHLRKGTAQPELDNFTHESLIYTLKKYRPDLTLVHFTDLDTQRHRYGFNSVEAQSSIKRHDKRLGEIIDTLKNENMYEDTTIILLGDHSALDVSKIIYLNSIFKQKGYIKVKNGKIVNWEVLSKTCDGSTYIYLKDKNNKHLVNEIELLLRDLAMNKENGIESIYTGKEAGELGADPNCTFMLEASLGYYFLDDIRDIFIREITPGESLIEKDVMAATHGYSPHKPDYTTVFMISGQGVREGVVIEKMSLLDEAPTMARLLGVELPESQGKVLKEFLI